MSTQPEENIRRGVLTRISHQGVALWRKVQGARYVFGVILERQCVLEGCY